MEMENKIQVVKTSAGCNRITSGLPELQKLMQDGWNTKGEPVVVRDMDGSTKEIIYTLEREKVVPPPGKGLLEPEEFYDEVRIKIADWVNAHPEASRPYWIGNAKSEVARLSLKNYGSEWICNPKYL